MINKNNFHTYNKPGFVLISVFLMMGIASILVIQLCTRVTIYNLFVPVVYEREQARSLALAGLTCALNQLAMKDSSILPEEEKKGEKSQPGSQGEERKRNFFLTLLAIQNRWQAYKINDEELEGEVGLYLMCEDGKIPLHYLMDFTTRNFVTVQKPALFKGQDCLEFICKKLEESKKGKDLFTDLKIAIKDRKYAFTAIEELLSLEAFKVFKDALYRPFPSDLQKHAPFYLQDCFTLCGKNSGTNPWFFTASLKNICMLKEEKKFDLKEYQKIVKILDFSKTALSQEWDKTLKNIYNKSIDKAGLVWYTICGGVRGFLRTRTGGG